MLIPGFTQAVSAKYTAKSVITIQTAFFIFNNDSKTILSKFSF